MEKYNPQKIEKKWQKKWEEEKIYKADDKSQKNKFYCLDMFPYPSAAGLHVGHPEGYTATDIISRYMRMNGKEVMHPMGWDAFGLPAENYAIKTGIHPKKITKDSIKNFRKQIKSLGFSYDWDREVATSDPEYYKWTQWIFLQFYKNGLAYKKKSAVNWCNSCKTVLANEQVVDGKCERCKNNVIQKDLEQWFFKITDYAEKLLDGLEKIDWPEPIKLMQREWIGKSRGSEIDFKVKDTEDKIKVFTTRADTLFGATYMVLAPEHEFVKKLESRINNLKEIREYTKKAKAKSDLERTELQKDKTGVEIKGIKAINPANQEEIPIYIADYVLSSYGTGAIMAVPAHDERDYEFAKKYNLPVKQVVAPLFEAPKGHTDAVKKDFEVEERNNVYVILKHWKEDKYLCLDWSNKKNWTSMVVGGVEEGESLKEAGEREIKEETGYKNFKFIKEIELSEIHSKFFADHKKINRYARARGVYFELIDSEQDEIECKEKDLHEIKWVEKDRVKEFMNFANWQYFWDLYVGNAKSFVGEGVLINSNNFSNLKSEEAKKKITEKVGGKVTTNYKLRDWLISRQRYWGAPIPIIYCDKCGEVPVPEDHLPVELVDDVDFKPTGESPLKDSEKFHKIKCPKCSALEGVRRESDTLDTFVCSSWYYLRYCDSKNKKEFANNEKLKQWMPVDLYVGGAEHACMHLIYARFFYKALKDLGYIKINSEIDHDEPFQKLKNQGMILGEDHHKMSKSRGNVINPDDVVGEYGADTLRMYEMFMGSFEEVKPWDTQSIKGIRRFLDKVWNLYNKVGNVGSQSDIEQLLHKTIKKVTEDIESFDFNTAISSMMVLLNKLFESEKVSKEKFAKFILLLSPFAPHIAEELWEKMGNKDSITKEKWPEYDEKIIKEDKFDLIIQINGKVRDKVNVNVGISEEEALKLARESKKIEKYIDGKKIIKIIMIKDRLLNIVVK